MSKLKNLITSTSFMNIVIFIALFLIVVYVKNKNLIWEQDISNYITLTIAILTLYGIFFAFLQFLIGNNSSENLHLGINKIEFAVLDKPIHKLVNLSVTKSVIISLIVTPIIAFVVSSPSMRCSDEILLLLKSTWEVCFLYLLILFGFILVQSLTSLFIIYDINTKQDKKIIDKIDKVILKEISPSMKNKKFWIYFDKKSKNIDDKDFFYFANLVYCNLLNYVYVNMPKKIKNYSEYRNKYKMNLYDYLSWRWIFIEKLVVKEKFTILEMEMIYLDRMDKKNSDLFKLCLDNTNYLFAPFYDILPKIKTYDDMITFIKLLQTCNYFNYTRNSKWSSIIKELFNSIKTNYSTVVNYSVEIELVSLKESRLDLEKMFLKELCYVNHENTIESKRFVKLILEVLGLDCVYAFILQSILNDSGFEKITFTDEMFRPNYVGSILFQTTLNDIRSEKTELENEINYFRQLYISGRDVKNFSRNSEYEHLSVAQNCILLSDSTSFERNCILFIEPNKENVLKLIKSTNIGHRINSDLINWILDDIDKNVSNETIKKINDFEYINYFRFLKIKFIFSSIRGNDFFDMLTLEELNKDTINQITYNYLYNIILNVELLNDDCMSSHHDAFIKKFENNFTYILEHQLKENKYKNKHIILYFLKNDPEVKEYLLSEKFVSKNESNKPVKIEDYYMDFFIINFEDSDYLELLNKNYIKEEIKMYLEKKVRDGELDDYFNYLDDSIGNCKKISKVKNLKTKVINHFEIRI